MKVAVVGGGSTYTPELVDGFARLAPGLSELALIDPAADRLAVVGPFGRRILARRGHRARLTWTTDPDAGLDGADIVIIQLRVGGQAARIGDETFPLECGCVGQETTGAGGLAKAMRTVPVVLDVARRARARATPGAWVIAFTNPVGIVTGALLDDGHRALGLCNVAIGMQRRFAALLGVPPAQVLLDHVGLNHLTWERAAVVGGVDRLPGLIAEHGDALAERVGLPRRLLELTGTVPSYYLRYFYAHDAVVREQLASTSRAAEVAEIERRLLELYADPALDEKPELLAQRGGAFYSEAAVQLAAALLGDVTASTHVVNLRNDGTLPFLPDDAVIEVPASVDRSGVRALPVGPLEPLYAGLVGHVTAYENLALEAARRGGRKRVVDALLAHPLVGQVELADGLADRLLAHNREHLSWA